MTPPVDRAGLLRPASMLSDAFRSRDLRAALSCFVTDDDISYTGSESGEHAHGAAAVAALFTDLFARPEAYSWDLHTATVHTAGRVAYLTCEATGHLHPDTGRDQTFPYRLSGLVQYTESGWKWRACHGCEPRAV
jgi:ketosteroid isomerase-like protein